MAAPGRHTSPAVVLVGPPSSGKTTVGRALADELAQDLVETDAIVERSAGMSVADLFLLRGEEEFRRLEREAVLSSLVDHPGVLVLGSGAVLDPDVRAALSGAFVVELHLPGPESAKRAGITGARPVQLGNVRSQWQRLLAERAPLYEEVADLRLDTSEQDVAACVDTIVGTLADRVSPGSNPTGTTMPAPVTPAGPGTPGAPTTPDKPATPGIQSPAATPSIDPEQSR